MTVVNSALDRAALPPPDVFFRQNVTGYRRFGDKARSRCPFHPAPNHHSHSKPFSIHLGNGLFHCFNCGVGGDIIEFVKLRDGVDFVTAARTLGAWRPLSRVEAKVYWHDRDAKQARQRRRDDEFCECLRLLLWEMQLAETTRDWAIRQGHEELEAVASELIDAVGADYVRLKVDYGTN
jgi:hypothetical protein